MKAIQFALKSSSNYATSAVHKWIPGNAKTICGLNVPAEIKYQPIANCGQCTREATAKIRVRNNIIFRKDADAEFRPTHEEIRVATEVWESRGGIITVYEPGKYS